MHFNNYTHIFGKRRKITPNYGAQYHKQTRIQSITSKSKNAMIKHLITLLCVLSIAIFNCDAATNQITKQIALQKVKAIYQDNDEEDFVDFYINEEDPDY